MLPSNCSTLRVSTCIGERGFTVLNWSVQVMCVYVKERERERASTCISHSQVEDALSDSAVQVKDDQLHCR